MIRKFALTAFALCSLVATIAPASAAGVTIAPAANVYSDVVQPVYHHHHDRHNQERRWHRPPPPHHWGHRPQRGRMVCWQERTRFWDGYRWRRGYEERCRPAHRRW